MSDVAKGMRFHLRKSLCDAFGGCCAYCGKPVGMTGTIDHYLPEALGGTNARENLKWCCLACNQEKADMHPAEWEKRAIAPAAEPTSKMQKRSALLSSIAPAGRPSG